MLPLLPTDIKDVTLRIKETLKTILLISFGAKKKFTLIKVNTDLLEQQAKLKKCNIRNTKPKYYH